MVNCCALTGAAARTPAATVPIVTSRPIVARMSVPSSGLCCLAPGEQVPNPDQRDVRYVGDQRQGDEIDYHERDDASIDRLELQPEHRLRDKDVDAERRADQTASQADRHPD